jgi:futalosine hydrolase
MPSLLLCAATPFEIAPTVERLRSRGAKVEVLITGVGLVATTWNLAQRLVHNPPGFLLQAGIAGAFDHSRKLADVVAVRRDTIGDQGVWEMGRFHSTFALGFGNPSQAPWEDGWLVNHNKLLDELALEDLNAVSVNQVTTEPAHIRYCRDELHASAESMEGAAFHYAAISAGIPFLQVRAFSNYIGERDKSRWQLRESIASLNHTLNELIPQLLEL